MFDLSEMPYGSPKVRWEEVQRQKRIEPKKMSGITRFFLCLVMVIAIIYVTYAVWVGFTIGFIVAVIIGWLIFGVRWK